MPSENCNRVRVERYFLEEAGTDEKRETGLHLEGCNLCKDHLDFLAREQKAYLAVRPFSSFAARHLEKKAPRFRLVPGPRWLPAMAGALACLALVAVMQWPGAADDAGTVEGTVEATVTYKGGEVFEFHYRRDGKVQEGSLGEAYRAGDELQFVYSADRSAHVALASVDAQGKVSLYGQGGSESGKAGIPARDGRLETFPFGVTLDAAPGRELFVLVISDAPVEASAVERWLAGAYREISGDLDKLAASLEPPAGIAGAKVKTLLLRKAST